MNSKDLLSEYVQAAIAWGEAIEKGDDVTANALHKRVTTLFLDLESSGTSDALLALLVHSDRGVRCWAGAHTLGMEPARAALALQQLSDGPLGGIRLMAQIRLADWHEAQTTQSAREA